MSAVPAKTREAVYERAGYCCEVCHVYARGGSLHHRRPRGMGGSKDPATNQASNLILLCGSGVTGCHGRIESNRAESIDAGLLVRQGVDPAAVPVDLHIGRVYLTDDACYDYNPPSLRSN